MDDALHRRIESIERRQFYTLSLLVGGYVFAGTWLLVETTRAVTVWNAGLGLLLVALLVAVVGVYRRRRART